MKPWADCSRTIQGQRAGGQCNACGHREEYHQGDDRGCLMCLIVSAEEKFLAFNEARARLIPTPEAERAAE